MTHDTTGAADLLTDLRNFGEMGPEGSSSDPLIEVSAALARDAASYITALQAENAALREAVRPFAEAWDKTCRIAGTIGFGAGPPDWYKAYVATNETGHENGSAWPLFEFGDLRRAARALKETGRE